IGVGTVKPVGAGVAWSMGEDACVAPVALWLENLRRDQKMNLNQYILHSNVWYRMQWPHTNH
ncbi:MAG TPA: hypothetical protein DIU08_07615, partial [Ktedonobacter sp.]|nr:hypothetical protein [Ktedonobacter sp.]